MPLRTVGFEVYFAAYEAEIVAVRPANGVAQAKFFVVVGRKVLDEVLIDGVVGGDVLAVVGKTEIVFFARDRAMNGIGYGLQRGQKLLPRQDDFGAFLGQLNVPIGQGIE